MKLKMMMLFALLGVILQARAQIIITGMMIDPVGGDGGYEYIQLMATEDIDFSVTPYALVRCVNTGTLGSVTADGWAAGGVRTFKFDLTKGKAAKGSFFYVGGEKKRIVGYWQKNQSTDISEKAENIANRGNWIRAIKYKGAADGTVVGDGFGEKTDGLLPNGSANPVGIGVFAGTGVTGASVPIDAVFVATASPISATSLIASYNAALGVGYLVPENDLYTLKKSKYFGDGGNTDAFLYPSAKGVGLEKDSGQFLMLGGIYNSAKKKWYVSRATNYASLCKDKNDASSATVTQLADIEKAKGVTKLK